MAHFSRSISIDPTYASAYHQLALIHYEHQDPQRMLMTCKKLIQHKPEDKNAWLYSGLAFQKMGDQNNAFGCYTRAIKYMSEEERAVMESVSYLIDEADEKEQAALSTDGVSDFSENPQAQEAFWRQQDPLHMTPFNERKMTHYGRVAYANLRFGRPEIGVEGWQTDRGRFYIRYGRWLKKQAQRPELNLTPGGSTLVAHTETWLYEGFSIQFRNWDGLDNWRFNNSKNYAQNYETASAKEFVKQNNARYIDPYRKQKYSVPNLVAAFKQNDSIRIEVAYALPKDRLQISADFQVEMDTGFFLYDTDWKATQQQTKSQIWTYPYSSKTPNSNYAFQKKTLYTSPGTYHLVAEAIDLNRKSIGTFRTQRSFAFPDTGLSMSDLLLASQIRPQNDFPNSREDLDIYPNPLRTYSQSHPVFIYLEIYDLMRNSYGRTHFDIAYRLSLPKSKDIDPTLFESQGLQEGELVITPNFDINGNTQYNVQYKMPKQNQITQNTSRTGQIETSVSAEYEGTKRNDFTYLEIDVGQLPKNIYQLMVMVTDKQANTHVTQHTLFRVVE